MSLILLTNNQIEVFISTVCLSSTPASIVFIHRGEAELRITFDTPKKELQARTEKLQNVVWNDNLLFDNTYSENTHSTVYNESTKTIFEISKNIAMNNFELYTLLF